MIQEKEMENLVNEWFDEMHTIPYGDIRCSGDFTFDELVEFGLWLSKKQVKL